MYEPEEVSAHGVVVLGVEIIGSVAVSAAGIFAQNALDVVSVDDLLCLILAAGKMYGAVLKPVAAHGGDVLIAEDKQLGLFPADKKKKFSITYNCLEMPDDEDGIKLHWTVSVHNKEYVIDIDVFCRTEEMLVRDYESPAGERKVLKVLAGGTGTGELRLYKKIRKNLEVLEHLNFTGAVCEYGNFEYPEK